MITTDNAFLGGRLQLLQPRDGYRAGVDPVFLAAACQPKTGARVLELGCGVGTALLCLGTRVPGLSLTGVELMPAHAALARLNSQRNHMGMRVVEADLSDLPADLRQEQFDVVMANPPYFERDAGTASRNASKEAGRGEGVALDVWVDVAARRLAPKGQAVFIQRTARLPELLAAFQARLGSLEIIPLVPREGRDAKLVILRGIKNGRSDCRMRAAVTLHCGATHGCDGEKYSPDIEAVLREAAELPVL
ncbi:tRNA1(Val) (adenine(37)-N6)-methyltransferase [Roseobacteraceae bacterium S113]